MGFDRPGIFAGTSLLTGCRHTLTLLSLRETIDRLAWRPLTRRNKRGGPVTGVLYGLARFCVRRRFVVLGVWFVVTIALVAVSHRLGDNTNDNLSLPGTDSQHATNALQSSFPAQANGTSPIVFHAKTGKLTDQNNANAVNQAATNLSNNKDVAAVVNPLTPQGASALSKNRPPATSR
jgi:hypothetical protein